MRPHFASTLYVVRQMANRTDRGIDSPAPPQPVVSSPHSVSTNGVLTPRRVMVLPEGKNLTIVLPDGRPFLEIVSGENGPEVRLAHNDVRIECPGAA